MRARILAASLAGLLAVGCSTQQYGYNSHLSSSGPPALPEKEPALTAETHFAAGQVAETQNNPFVAITQYKQALQLNPKHLGALYRLGIVYAQLKQYPKAIETWELYVAATNQSATAYADLGFCHEIAGQPDQARAAYLTGISRDPKNISCRVNYGLLLARQGRTADAIAQWQVVLTPAEIHYNLGSVDVMLGKKDQARAEFTKAITIDPKFDDARTRLTSLDE